MLQCWIQGHYSPGPTFLSAVLDTPSNPLGVAYCPPDIPMSLAFASLSRWPPSNAPVQPIVPIPWMPLFLGTLPKRENS